MTTQDLDQEGIRNLRAAMQYSAENVRQQAEATLAEADRINTEMQQDERDAEIARRLLRRSHLDNLSVVDERASQYAEILGDAEAPTATPVVESEELPPPAAEPEPHDDQVVDQTTAVVRRRVVDVFDVRDWSWRQWVLAILGFIAGIIVARFTWHPLYGDIRGAGRGWLTTLWFIAVMALGFFGGGFLGSLKDPESDEE